jgi:hypothetical protein
MLEILKEVVAHCGLASVECVRFSADANQVLISSQSGTRDMYISGVIKAVVPEIRGTFGVPSIGRLKAAMALSEYAENAVIECDYRDDNTSVIRLKNAANDFTVDFRLMAANIVKEVVKVPSLKSVTWATEFEPSVIGVSRMRSQLALAAEPTISTTVGAGACIMEFGDVATNSGAMVFAQPVTGDCKQLLWNGRIISEVMAVVGDKKIRISEAGVMEIVVSDNLGTWTYLIPATNR